MSVPFISVFTITFNQEDRLVKSVEGLFAQDYPKDRYEIVVLNDGSSDGTGAALTRLSENAPVPLTVVTRTHDADYLNARRWNEAIAACRRNTDAYIQIDDVEMRSDFVARHAWWHAQPEDYLVTGSKFEADETTWDLATCQRGHLAGPGSEARIVPQYTAVWGASMSYSRKGIERIYHPPFEIPYDERMNGWGYHEVEFAYRMQRAGTIIVYDPRVGVFHKNHVQSGELKRGLDRDRLVSGGSIRNEQYMLEKHRLPGLVRW